MDHVERTGPTLPPSTPSLAIAAVVIPPRGQGRHAAPPADLLVCQAMKEAHALELWGSLERCPTLDEALEYWRGTEYEERRLFLARDGGEPVGLCSVTLPLRENLATAGIDVLVVPGGRRRGVGRRLLEHAEAVARARSRSTLEGFHEVPLDKMRQGSRMVTAKSGAGHLPAEDPATAFALASGYQLEQVERSSRL